MEPLARRDIAVEVLERKRSAAQVAREEGVSHKFVAAQVTRAREAIDEAFVEPGTDLETADDDRVLFQIDVTRRLTRRGALGQLLYCHSCYRWLQEFLQDVLLSLVPGREGE